MNNAFQTTSRIVPPTAKQKHFAYDISNLLGYALPQRTLGDYAKFIAEHTEEYYAKRTQALSELKKEKTNETVIVQEYTPDTNGKYVLQEVSSRLRLQNVKPRMSDYPLESANNIIKFIQKQQRNLDCEQILIINLDTQKLPINICQVASGNQDGLLSNRQDIFKTAILSNAESIMVFHSTPCVNATPTCFDRTIAHSIASSGDLLGIPLESYVLVSNTNIYIYQPSTDFQKYTIT